MFDRFQKRDSNNMQWGVFASGLALGSIIGAGIAMLLTPRSGEEVRSMISEKSSDLKDQIGGKVDEVRGQAEQEFDSAKTNIESQFNGAMGNKPL